MIKSILTTLFAFFTAGIIFAQTQGSLSVTASTSTAGGGYAPKNIVAIWIEDAQGNWVKTLLAYAQTRKTHLNTWEAATTAAGSVYNTVDAITGATKTSHGTRTCTWDGTDVNGTLVADGTYTVWMELTDKNSTGNYSHFTFTKGPAAESQTPANVPSFSSISINWVPVITAVNDPELEKSYQVTPNPTKGIFQVTGKNITEVQVLSQAGTLIFSGLSTQIDISNQADGVYIIKISTDKGIVTRKILKD
jgi:hypothetical protein